MEEYIQSLLREQGVPDDLDPEIREELALQLNTRAVNLVNQRLLDAMSDEAIDEFNTMMEDESVDQARVQAFVAEHVPNREQVTTAALTEFRQLYLGEKA